MLPFFALTNINYELFPFFLLPEERKEFSKLKFPKRKIEWLNARYIAKKLISEKVNCDWKEVLIYNDNDRKPFAVVKNRRFRISLSHRGDLCGCAINRDFSPFIGLDIEKIEVKDKVWLDFFDEDEIDNNIEMIKLWTLKEAILKMLGLGLSVNLKEIKLKNGKIIFSGKMEKYEKLFRDNVRYKIYRKDDYVIALSWLNI